MIAHPYLRNIDICPQTAYELLKEGNLRFISNMRVNRNFYQEIEATKETQNPFAVTISCMDSRTTPELIFDQGFGDIFSIRIAGNVITPEVIGSVEYACKVAGSKLILVLGHKGCGAINGAIQNVEFGSLATITGRIKKCMKNNDHIDDITTCHVQTGMETLTKDSEILHSLVVKGSIKIIGAVYDISTGEVLFLNEVSA